MEKILIQNENGQYVWLDVETGRTTSAAPATLSNQTVNQANNAARQAVKINNKTPKTVGEGHARTNARHRQNGTTPDTNYTQRRIAEATAATWRTDAADAMHLLGETTMASTPITATSYFGAKALNDVVHGNAGTSTALNASFAAMPWLRPFRAASVATTTNLLNEAKQAATKGFEKFYNIPNWAKKLKKNITFKSELDWTPESWFSTRQGYGYDAEDVAALKKHVPEYHKIERKSKANGTWLKMPDGSTWTGDPRSWVLLLSKAVKDYDKDVFWSGRLNYFNPEYIGEVWGIRGRGKIPGLLARTYATSDAKVTPLISENVPINSYNAHGNSWTRVFGREEGNIYTNDIVNRDFSEGAKRVHIDNVIDPGPNFVPMSSRFRTGDKMLDYNLLDIPQNDVIVAQDVIRKSMVGNNGNFSKTVKNAYKGLIFPLAVGYSAYKF